MDTIMKDNPAWQALTLATELRSTLGRSRMELAPLACSVREQRYRVRSKALGDAIVDALLSEAFLRPTSREKGRARGA